MQACLIGYEEAVGALIDLGADVNKRNEEGETPLAFACKNGNVSIVDELISHGAKINVTDSSRCSPLTIAIDNDKVDVVELLIVSGANVAYFTKRGWCPLSHACYKGNLKVVKMLLTAGAVITPPDHVFTRQNLTHAPLMIAAREGHADIIKELVETADGTEDPDFAMIIDGSGRQPLWWALKNNMIEIALMLIPLSCVNLPSSDNEDRSLLSFACGCCRDEAVIKAFLDAGADLESIFDHGNRDGPLYNAAILGNANIVRLLLEQRSIHSEMVSTLPSEVLDILKSACP